MRNGAMCVLEIATCSPDCSILTTDVETGSPNLRLEHAHGWVLYLCCIMLRANSFVLLRCYILSGSDAISRLINLDKTTIATGDDEGCIKVWDTRQRSLCNSFDAHCDYVSDITFRSGALLATRYFSRLITLSLLPSSSFQCH
jgi:hypothetical protein